MAFKSAQKALAAQFACVHRSVWLSRYRCMLRHSVSCVALNSATTIIVQYVGVSSLAPLIFFRLRRPAVTKGLT